jgi:ribose-phosphate pyrophosphokinase
MRLFALQGTRALGQAVADAIGIELDGLEEREFADGEHKARPLISVRNEDVFVLHSLHGSQGRSPADQLLRLLFFIGACRDNSAARVTAVVPYLAFMRKEQQTKARDPVNSRYVAELLEAVGTDMVVALEVHNPAAFQNAFRCGNTHLDARHLFVAKVEELSSERPVVFLSPDSGGMRRTHALYEAYCADGSRVAGLAMMEKHRSEGRVTGALFAGEVEGADVFIVDDMISTGGTMLRAARASRVRGAERVMALATHGLFSEGSRELFRQPEIDKVIVTDSVASEGWAEEVSAGKLEIISCARLLGDAIQRLHSGGSIHRLLNPLP